MTQEDRQEVVELIKQVVTPMLEQQLMILVETSANVVQEKIVTKKMIEQFYKDNPEFVVNKDIAAGMIEKVQADNPGMSFPRVLEKAAPIIKEHIVTIGALDMQKGVKPDKPMFDGDMGEL
jgi:hypothetical protein